MQRVVIGLSGGRRLLGGGLPAQEQGYEVVGLFMINWHDTTGTLEGDCPWHGDRVFAELVARRLDIPFHVVDLSEEYRRRVVDYMFAEYERGRTPNPDVLCNREIKFDVFLKEALRLGADFVATGHYCRRECVAAADGTEHYRLLAGVDGNKGSELFPLPVVAGAAVAGAFPRRGLTKPEVRRIAEEQRTWLRPGARIRRASASSARSTCRFSATEARGQTGQRPRDRADLAEIRPHCGSRRPSGIGRAVALHRARRQEDRRAQRGPFLYDRPAQGTGDRRPPRVALRAGHRRRAERDLCRRRRRAPGLYRKALFMKAGDLHWIDPAERMRAGQRRRFRGAYPLPPAVAGRRTRRVRRGRVSAFSTSPSGRHARPVRRLVRRGDAGRFGG